MSDRGDVESSLAEMDRKLRALQHELASVSGEEPPPPAARGAPAEPRPGDAPPRQAPPTPERSGAHRVTDSEDWSAEARASAIVAQARAEAARIIDDAAQRVVDMSSQLDSLRREVERMVAEFTQTLRAGTEADPRSAPAPAPGEWSRPQQRQPGHQPPPPPRQQAPPPQAPPPQAPPPQAPPPQAPPPQAPPPQAPPPQAREPQPQAPDAGARQPPAGSGFTPPPRFGAPLEGGAESGGEPPAGGAPAAAPVAGTVQIDAGPFMNVGMLGSFEQALRQLPGAGEVYVRSFEGDRAVISIVLGQQIALVDELSARSPWAFEVRHAQPDSLTLDFSGAQTPPAGM